MSVFYINIFLILNDFINLLDHILVPWYHKVWYLRLPATKTGPGYAAGNKY